MIEKREHKLKYKVNLELNRSYFYSKVDKKIHRCFREATVAMKAKLALFKMHERASITKKYR